MPFPANQVVNYFCMFISLLMAICLAAVRIMASHQAIGHAITSACQVPSQILHMIGAWSIYLWCHLSGHVSQVPQQLNSRQDGEFLGHHVESLLGSLVLSSVHSMIIITNTLKLINQTESYYVITNFYLRSQLYPITLMISLLLHSISAPAQSRVITTISSYICKGYNQLQYITEIFISWHPNFV